MATARPVVKLACIPALTGHVSSKRIPVYAAERLIEFCDSARANHLALAHNVTSIRSRRGDLVRLNIRMLADDRPVVEPTGGSSVSLTYPELLGGHEVTILKRYDDRTGTFKRWNDDDAFDPGRFNPDLLPISPVGRGGSVR